MYMPECMLAENKFALFFKKLVQFLNADFYFACYVY